MVSKNSEQKKNETMPSIPSESIKSDVCKSSDDIRSTNLKIRKPTVSLKKPVISSSKWELEIYEIHEREAKERFE